MKFIDIFSECFTEESITATWQEMRHENTRVREREVLTFKGKWAGFVVSHSP